jgi:phosphoheptose isomerase
MLQFAEVSAHPVATEYLARLSGVLRLVPAGALGEAVELLLDARRAGRRVYLMGNGGSAATASHIACDLVKTAQVPSSAPLRVFALADNAALLTAWANDCAYEQVFAEQILAFVEPEDIVVAITASGNSPNILAGLKAATERGAHTIALVGFDGGAARELADLVLHVPSHDYGLVEDTHAAIGHALTAALRSKLMSEAGLLVSR